MIRISATTLEAYRRWLDNPEATIDDMVAYLEKKITPNEAMLAGSAFHKVLENNENITLDCIEADGFIFDFSGINEAIYIPKIKEYKFELPAIVKGEGVTFVGVVDAMESGCIYDHKLTASANAEDYTDSMQWRCYLSWLGLNKFTYNLFQKYNPSADPDRYIIKSVLQVSFNRYPEIDNDVNTMAARLVDFIKNHANHLIH